MPELHLDALAFGGDAVGRLDGKVVFVPFGAPGDTVEIEILEARHSYSRARIIRLLEPGHGRREPPCGLFGECGGCHWQMVDYALQTAAKHAIFKRCMVEAAVEHVIPMAGAPAELGYRRRCRLHWEASASGVTLGYYRRGSRSLLDVPTCPLLVAPLQEAVDRVRDALNGLQGRGNLAAIADLTGQRAHVSLRFVDGDHDTLGALAGALEGAPGLAGGQISHAKKVRRFGAEWINLRLPDEDPMWGSATAFAQANIEQDRVLRRSLEQWVQLDGARVLELFAGVGNLTRGLCGAAAEVIAVEGAPASAKLLRHNAPDVRVIKGDVTSVLTKMKQANERFDLVVLDPPREGCARAAPLIAALRPRQLLYVSCDPMTMARDIRLLARHGLTPRKAQALDMMPQTYHIEGLALMGS